MKTREIKFLVQEFDSINELAETDQQLLLKAREITDKAYAPYSGFKVGASILLQTGKIIRGTNQENMAYPSGLCAERVALFTAGSEFPDVPIKTIAITAKNKDGIKPELAAPCGACRQVMLESENRSKEPMRIILDGKPILILNGVESLLPFSFSPAYL